MSFRDNEVAEWDERLFNCVLLSNQSMIGLSKQINNLKKKTQAEIVMLIARPGRDKESFDKLQVEQIGRCFEKTTK